MASKGYTKANTFLYKMVKYNSFVKEPSIKVSYCKPHKNEDFSAQERDEWKSHQWDLKAGEVFSATPGIYGGIKNVGVVAAKDPMPMYLGCGAGR